MKRIQLGLLLLAALFAAAIRAQEPADTARINSLLQSSKEKFNQDPAVAMSIAYEAKDLSVKVGYQKGVATALKNIGTAYYLQGNPEEALVKWQEALVIFEQANDLSGVADVLGNIGNFYYYRGDEIKALEHHLRSLKIAERIGYKKATVSALNNIGGVYYNKSATYDKALHYYLMALPLCRELGDMNVLGAICVNVGNIYQRQDDHEKALEYFDQALTAYADNPVNISHVHNALGSLYLKEKNLNQALTQYQKAMDFAGSTNSKLSMIRSLVGIGMVYSERNNYTTAVAYYKKAESIAKETNAALELESLYREAATAYEKQGNFKNALHYQTLLTKIKESLYNEETDKRVATLQFDFDLEKKQNEINLLTKDKSIKELQLKRQATFQNALVLVLALIVAVLFLLYRGYRAKAKNNRILDKKNTEIERLLLNILPAEVAAELQSTGKATPRQYDSVAVMFTDFNGFTSLTEKMAPQDLVEELSRCFMAFDEIIEQNGLERIKTIGDAYMCAGGIPVPSVEHPVYRMVKASLEIQEYIRASNEARTEKGLPPWNIRIGIHVGPVVAGVVGIKKYAYDIWGNTVNIASRMESSGIPGHVNISSATYEMIKDQYACVYRGKINAKNIGDIDMYLIDHKLEKPRRLVSLEEVQTTATLPYRLPDNLLQ